MARPRGRTAESAELHADQGFGDFAYAAARRYPWVRLWTAWNEANLRLFAAPVSLS